MMSIFKLNQYVKNFSHLSDLLFFLTYVSQWLAIYKENAVCPDVRVTSELSGSPRKYTDYPVTPLSWSQLATCPLLCVCSASEKNLLSPWA